MSVLCVDDDTAFLMLYREFFGAMGVVDVEMVTGCEQAWSCLERRSFDAVITDLCLGENVADGKKLVRWLVERGRSEVIIIAAGGQTARDEWPTEAKIGRIMVKPFSFHDLWSILRELIPSSPT